MKTKSIFPLFLLAGTLLTAACATPTAKQAGNNSFEWGQVPQQPDLSWADSVGSRQMPGNHVILSANSFGAVADSTVLSTEAIQKAIDSCAVIGGGTVVLQPGYYQTGALFIKSGVNLQLDKGVTLLASPSIHHYPEFRSRIAGIEMTWPAAVINIVNEKNASVSGEGTLDCRGKVFWDKYWEMRKEYEAKGLRWIVDYDCKRVRGILIERSSDITLKGFTLMRTGFWGCQILYSDYCTIDGLTINNNIGGHGPSTDGIDIDSSCNILVENCDVDCNDDNICIKSGRDADGLRVNLPTENVDEFISASGWNDSLRLENFYLYAIEAQTDKPGKICYTKNFNLSEITLKTEEKNVIELKENEQSNINFNYVKTSPDHRTAGNLAH